MVWNGSGLFVGVGLVIVDPVGRVRPGKEVPEGEGDGDRDDGQGHEEDVDRAKDPVTQPVRDIDQASAERAGGVNGSARNVHLDWGRGSKINWNKEPRGLRSRG